MKKIKIFLILILSLSCFLTSCGSFFGDEDEALQIYSIESELQQDGTTKITITYSNEDKAPDVFFIPQGEKGQDGVIGNGIKTIKYEPSEDGMSTKLIVEYTDSEVENTEFVIPNGVSVTGVEYKLDPATKNTLMYLTYSNGEKSKAITILKGSDGNGISSYELIQNEDGSQTLVFSFTQSDDVKITIPAPIKGNGIDSIISKEDKTHYILQINYENGVVEEVKFNKPEQPNAWYSGLTRPDESLGKDGDYYFDTQHEEIYLKENGSWILIVEINANEQIFKVKFDVNDSVEEPASMPAGSLNQYLIKRGTVFSDNGYGEIPIPTRSGYTFVGWYRSKVVTPINSPFTDMVAVNSDITLYAIWQKN